MNKELLELLGDALGLDKTHTIESLHEQSEAGAATLLISPAGYHVYAAGGGVYIFPGNLQDFDRATASGIMSLLTMPQDAAVYTEAAKKTRADFKNVMEGDEVVQQAMNKMLGLGVKVALKMTKEEIEEASAKLIVTMQKEDFDMDVLASKKYLDETPDTIH